MVTFICNSCGQSVKKQQVEKHCHTKCRDCQSLACVDCGKDFWGDDYQNHTKCITENEKYGGKDYRAKENKGERKQEDWFKQVQEAIDNCTDHNLKQWLQKLENYPNVPRKKAKFENFINTNMRVPPHLQSRVWEAISAELNKPKSPAENGQNASNNTNGDVPKLVPENSNANNSESAGQSTDIDNALDSKKLSKRERKEERKKAKHKAEKKDRKTEETEEQEEEMKAKKKKKKRKRPDEDALEEDTNEDVPSTSNESKKKKKKDKHVEDEPTSKRRKEDNMEENTVMNTTQDLPKVKFSWEDTIVAVLQKQDDKEIPVKKLRKKVLAEFHACGGGTGALTEEKLLAKFNKKIEKNPRFRVLKDRVKLIS